MQAKCGGKRPLRQNAPLTAKAPMNAPRPSWALNRRNAAAKGTAKQIAFAPHRPGHAVCAAAIPALFFIDLFPSRLNRAKRAKGGCSKEQPPFPANESREGAQSHLPAPLKCDAIYFQMLFGKPTRAAYALRPAQGILQDRRGWGMPIKPNPRCPGLLPAVPGRSSP